MLLQIEELATDGTTLVGKQPGCAGGDLLRPENAASRGIDLR